MVILSQIVHWSLFFFLSFHSIKKFIVSQSEKKHIRYPWDVYSFFEVILYLKGYRGVSSYVDANSFPVYRFHVYFSIIFVIAIHYYEITYISIMAMILLMWYCILENTFRRYNLSLFDGGISVINYHSIFHLLSAKHYWCDLNLLSLRNMQNGEIIEIF